MSKKQKKDIRKIIAGVIIAIGIFIYNNFFQVPINDLLGTYLGENDDDNTLPTIVERHDEVSGDLIVRYIDVGQADSILISTGEHNMLIDAGNNEDGKKLVTYFNDLGIEEFDYIIGTHPHEDHIGGMDDILRNFNVDTMYLPDVVTTSKTFLEVLDVMEEKEIAFETPEVDSTFDMGDAKFSVLYVGQDESDLNNSSIVIRMDFGSKSFLFTGDAPSSIEKQILDKNIDVDVLKVGHHGSQYSSSAAFLNKVTPDYAIIEVGENNMYGHPKDVILTRLERMNTKIYRTDEKGTIIIKSDGEKLDITTQETDTNG